MKPVSYQLNTEERSQQEKHLAKQVTYEIGLRVWDMMRPRTNVLEQVYTQVKVQAWRHR